MASEIHPTALIAQGASIGDGCKIQPCVVISAEVEIGEGCEIGPHTVIQGHTSLGPRNRIGSHCSFGSPPQELSYRGEPTRLVVGADDLFGDYVQLNRGSTKGEDGTTRVGDGNYLMAYAHVGHDCVIGDRIIAANAIQLAGHVTVEDGAVIGGLVAVHQHVRIGKLSIIAGGSATGLDIPPFVRVGGYGCAVNGINAVGLERAGRSRPQIKRLRAAYKILFQQGIPWKEAIAQVEAGFADCADALHMARFIRDSKRGVVRNRALSKS